MGTNGEKKIPARLVTTRPTASLVIYISSYPARPRRITVKYHACFQKLLKLSESRSDEGNFSSF